MSIDPLDRVAAHAPQHPVDPDGLTRAFAAFERGTRATERPASTALARRFPTPRRHVRRLVLAGAAALVVTAGAVVIPAIVHQAAPDPTQPGSAASQFGPLITGLLPAAAADDDCRSPELPTDEPASLARAQWSTTPIASITGLVGEATPDTVTAYEALRRCPTAVAVATVYDDGGTTGLNVYRDVATDGMTSIEELGSAKATTIRGGDGYVLAWINEGDRPRQRLTWFDADGVRWYAESDGLPVDTTLAVLDALTFDPSGALESTSVPTGFRAATTTDPAVGAEPTYTWVAEYGLDSWTVVERDGGSYDQPGAEYARLVVSTPAIEPIEARVASHGATLVDLDGTTATWGGGQGGLEIAWVQDGAKYRLTAPVATVDELLALARTVHVVPTDDPRLG